MKILLVYPYCLEDRIHEEDVGAVPMGLFSIGALLRQEGYPVEVLNLSGLGRNPNRIREILAARRPRVVGFSVLNANRWGAIDIARMAKSLDPTVTVVFGGVAATHLWHHFLTHFPEVDFTVMGEGEIPFLHLIRHLEAGSPGDSGAVPGIGYQKDGRPVRTDPAEPIPDLDALPNPAQYYPYRHLSLTRGCPGRCTFCGSPDFWGRRVRFHSPGYFVDQMEMQTQKGERFFYVSDDTFTLRKSKVIEVCKEILRRRLSVSWAAISRVDCVDEEVLLWMRRAGCAQISYGVESGSADIRSLLGKPFSADVIETAFALTTAYGILPRAYFIYGCPGETRKTIDETLALIQRIRPLSAIFYILDVFPGTDLYAQFKQNFGVNDDIWLERIEDILYFEYDPDLSREDVLAFGDMLRTGFYRALPGFTDAIAVADREDLYPLHADFFSKLGMTFSHGDYANIEAIPDPDAVAERLYRRSLRFAPDHRGFVGLAEVLQRQGAWQAASAVIEEGLGHYPDSEDLTLCAGIARMNRGRYAEAIDHLLKFPDSARALLAIAQCHQAMNQPNLAALYRRRLQTRSGQTPNPRPQTGAEATLSRSPSVKD